MARRAVLLLVLLPVLGAAPAAQDDPARARAAYARAVQLEQDGNHAAALSLLWEAAGLDPRNAEIQSRLGEALERIGALDAAIEAYREALAVRPGLRRVSGNLVLALVKAGRGAEGIERARALVAAHPDDADQHFTLGLALAEQDVEAAITSFRQALALDGRHALARYNLALVLRRADRLEDAVAELTRAIRDDPRAEAHYTLGVIHWHTGDLVRARRALEAAVAAAPGYVDAHYTLGAVHRAARDWHAAAGSLRRAIELRPDLWGAHNTLGLVLQQAGHRAEASRHLAEGERLRRLAALEQEAGVWTAVGTAKLDANDPLGAVDSFRRATTLLDTYAPAHYQMGRALLLLGEAEAAESAFARARVLNPALVPPPAP